MFQPLYNDGFDENLPAFVTVHQVLLDGGASCDEPDANGHDVAMLALKAADQNCVTCIQQRGGGPGLQWQSVRQNWKFGVFVEVKGCTVAHCGDLIDVTFSFLLGLRRRGARPKNTRRLNSVLRNSNLGIFFHA